MKTKDKELLAIVTNFRTALRQYSEEDIIFAKDLLEPHIEKMTIHQLKCLINDICKQFKLRKFTHRDFGDPLNKEFFFDGTIYNIPKESGFVKKCGLLISKKQDEEWSRQ